jgi:hypothetical protein
VQWKPDLASGKPTAASIVLPANLRWKACAVFCKIASQNSAADDSSLGLGNNSPLAESRARSQPGGYGARNVNVEGIKFNLLHYDLERLDRISPL